LTPEPLTPPVTQNLKIQINGNTNNINNRTRLSPGPAAGDFLDADARSTTSNTGWGMPVAFPDGAPLPPNIPPVPATPEPSVHSVATKKLKKLRKGTGDGYESESGYLSEGGRKSKEKDTKKKAKAKEGKSDIGLMVDPNQRTRKRSFVDAVRGKKAKDVDIGYATDGTSSKMQKSKDKTKAKLSKYKDAEDTHYETDGGTKKSKTKSFFKLSSKSSKPDLTKDRATTPPVPLLKEQMPLPIALRFATTLPSSNNGSTLSLDEARSSTSHGTSMPQSSLDGFSSTTSLGVSSATPGPSKFTANEVPSLIIGKLPSLSFQPLNVPVDVAQPPSPQSAPPHLPSPPVSFPHSAQSPGTIRDSQASSQSSSSGASNPRSRTTTSEASITPSIISSSFTSTSHSHFQISSPRIGHGLGAGSTSTTTSMSQHSHGYHYGQNQRIDNFGRPSAVSRPTSPPSSAAAAAAAAGMMSFQITRDVSTVPLMMRQYQQEQQEQQGTEPLAQIQDDGHAPTQIPQPVETEQVEAYPRRMEVALPAIPPLNISKGGGLRIKPSLEKINILGLRKDNREQLSAGGATPLSISPAPFRLSHSANSQMSAGQSGFPTSPMHQSPLLSSRSRNGTPISPPNSLSPGNLTLSPHTFISAPNSSTSSPVFQTNTSIPPRSQSRSRLSLNPPPNSNQLVAPNVLAYYDIPPPSPPPMGPLPLPPQLPGDGSRITSPISPRNRSRSPIPPYHNHPPDGTAAQLPSPAQLRQRMLDRTPRRLPSEDPSGAGPNPNLRRGKEPPFPPAPIFQKTLGPDGVSSSGASDESAESGEGVVYHVEPPPRSPILPVPLNNQEKRVLDSVLSRKEGKRSSWIDFGDVLSIRDNDTSEEDIGSRNDEQDVDGSVEGDDGSLEGASEIHGNRSEESAYSDRQLTRSRSSEALKPANSNSNPPQVKYAWDDSLTIGDRTSRWSGSIYSRMSIMDEEESNAARDRFVKRVEAMLADGGSNTLPVDETGGGVARQTSRRGVGRNQFVPPVPKIPDAFVGPTRSEAASPGRMWNKF